MQNPTKYTWLKQVKLFLDNLELFIVRHGQIFPKRKWLIQCVNGRLVYSKMAKGISKYPEASLTNPELEKYRCVLLDQL